MIEAMVRFHLMRLVLLLIILPATLPPPVYAQTRPVPAQEPRPEDEQRIKLEREQAKKANLERQAQLKRDAEQLLKLATELKQYVEKTNENMLSVEVVKKAGEIEKLAHSVKDKMKGN